jgi:hypothetical protein
MSQQMSSLAWDTEVATPVMKCVLAALADKYQEKTDLCFPSITTISKLTCMNRQSVINNIKKLEDVGLISVERDGGTGTGAMPNQYTFNTEKMGLKSKENQRQSQLNRLPPKRPQIEAKYKKRTTSNDSKVYEIDPNYISEHFPNNQTPFISDKEVKEQEHPGYGKTIESIPNKQVGIKQ